jgi:hypothetical protein
MAKRKILDVNQLLQEGLGIIQQEVEKIKKNKVIELLDTKAAATLNDYMRTLLAMKREDRAAEVEETLEKLSDEELNKLAEQYIGKK